MVFLVLVGIVVLGIKSQDGGERFLARVKACAGVDCCVGWVLVGVGGRVRIWYCKFHRGVVVFNGGVKLSFILFC